ncbi:MAG TPA: aminodeoxychorismate synthase component I [Thermodesulfatator sp.]|nr:aminodeoxychorismate synthase component I [Thermodesulfatator sp.]
MILGSSVKKFVFLDTARKDSENTQSLLFTNPIDEIWLRDLKDLRRLKEALNEGLFVAGYLKYELGYLLEPKLYSLLPKEEHLGWLGVFKAPEAISPGEVPWSKEETVEIDHLQANLSKQEYLSCIRKIKNYIAQGDTYQVNFTFKLKFSYRGSPFALYNRLRRQQPVAYAALINDGQGYCLSLSPELFFRMAPGEIWSRPMKGTAPRGRTLAEDELLRKSLASDPKNRAENVMIVDLIRNDLARICEPGSVYVPRLFEVERYRTVHQMTSTVWGKPEGRPDPEIVLKALFPCGSVTGAPKIRTMEIIAELEKEPRGIYTGAIGYFSPQGEACFNVAIRTVILREGRGEMGIGSGIVYDSDPPTEYEECLLKGRFLYERLPEFALIETIFLEDGSFYLLENHLRRLRTSAAYFQFSLDEGSIRKDLSSLATSLGRGRFKVRLLLEEDGRHQLEASPLSHSPPVPLRFTLAPERVNSLDPFFYHKTTYRPLFNLWQKRLQKLGLDEVVFLNERGELTEGTIFNLFLELEDGLVTPALTSGLLPGTLREELLRKGICKERVLYPDDLRRAQRIFLGNSVRGLLRAEFVENGVG